MISTASSRTGGPADFTTPSRSRGWVLILTSGARLDAAGTVAAAD